MNGNPWTGWNPSNGYPTDATVSSGDGYTLVISNGNIPTVYDAKGDNISHSGGPETPNGNISVNDETVAGVTVLTDDLGSPLLPTPSSSCVSNYPPSGTDYLRDIPYQAKPDQVCADTVPAWDGSSGTVTYTFTSSYIPVCTNFFSGNLNAGEFCGGVWALTSIKLPDNTNYVFSYDSGTDPGHYGTLSSITWPTGGTTLFAYRITDMQLYTVPLRGRVLLTSITEGNDVTTLSYSANPSSAFSALVNWYPLTITYPAHAIAAQGPNVLDTTTYSLAQTTVNGLTSDTLSRADTLNNTLVSTMTRDYTYPTSPSYTEMTWNESGDKLRTEFTYSSNSQLSYEKQYVNGSLYRTVHTTFLGDTGSIPYVTQYHMLAYPSIQQILDAGNHVIAQTNYTYDEYGASFCNGAALTSVTGAIGHDDSRGTNWYARGNPTTVSSTGQGGASVTTHKCYDTLGNVTQTVDGNGNATQLSYVDAFSNTNCLITGRPTYALPTTVTDALGHVSTSVYNSCNRAASTNKDPNDIANSTSGTRTNFDVMGRSQCVTTADGGQSCKSYAAGSATSYQTTQTLTAGSLHTVQVSLDSYGQLSKTIDQSSGVEVETVYGTNGLLRSQTNPYFSSGSPSGTTSYYYDGESRLVAQQQSDGATISHSYVALSDTFTDEAGHVWNRTSDPLDRLVSVTEPTNAVTNYMYDTLNNLLTTTQHGASGEVLRSRSFIYDSLSRLTSSSNPETGTIGYTYDSNSNVQTKTDARNATTSYSYDALNRLTSKSRSGGSTDFYSYDGNLNSGGSAFLLGNNLIGRLSFTRSFNPALSGPSCDINGKRNCDDEYFGYDVMGRVTKYVAAPPSVWGSGYYTVTATYDLAGNVTGLTYPDGRQIQQTWNGAGQLGDPLKIAVLDASTGQTYLNKTGYAPDGSVATLAFGNGLSQSISRNNRLQVQAMSATSLLPNGNLQNVLGRTYCYSNCPSGGASNNGNIWGITDTLNASRTQAFAYDALNRLNSFSLGGSVYQTYAIDSFGNMSPVNNGNLLATFDANNRNNSLPCLLVTAPFDAAGNQLCSTDENGSISQYSYDAESRISQIAALNSSASPFVKYTYDANGTRIRKDNADGTFTEYISFHGQPIAEKDQNNTWTDYIYANGSKIARVVPAPVLDYSGVCGNCSGGVSNMATPGLANGVAGYVLRPQDVLMFQQKQVSANAGLYLFATDGSNSAGGLTDSSGDLINASRVADGTWHTRVVDLTNWAGKQIGSVGLSVEATTPTGVQWDSQIANISLISIDGTVHTLFTGQPVSGTPWNASANTTLTMPLETEIPVAVHYYAADHLGTTLLDLASGGYPVWQGQFAPFGQEIKNRALLPLNQPDGSTNHYKFTGKERDTESGLDYFGARYYGSSMGRFMSPDPGGLLFQKPQDPQSWNLYAYARNNPLSNVDPTGLDCVYANDAGNRVESIDHSSNSGECGSNGGSWVPGYANENWARFNGNTQQFQVASLNNNGSLTANYTMFGSGAETQFNGDESSCTGGCSGFASTGAQGLADQLVGNSTIGGYLTFLAGREEPVQGGGLNNLLSGPGLSPNGPNNWAGPGGMGPPTGQGDWAASVHDYNFNANGHIGIGDYFNPTLSPATARALIQSNNNLITHAGGVQSVKMGMFFGVVNAFQLLTNAWR